jgi:P4 family phage/plasmid primase-like protien
VINLLNLLTLKRIIIVVFVVVIIFLKLQIKETLIKGIIGYVSVKTDLWDLNPDLIGFENGVYDLANDIFRDSKYDDYISLVIDYKYYESTEEELDMIDKYFKKIMPVDEERKLLLLLLATTFTGRHLEKFIVCTGNGRNGKDTTFTYQMKKVLGPYYYHCNQTAFTETIKSDQNVSIANMSKKRIVITTEPDKEKTIKTSLIKSLTGSDEIAMRTLYSTNTKVHLNETLFMLCNDKPALDQCEQAMMERLIVIPFRCTFKTTEWMIEHGITEGENNVYTANEEIKSESYLNKIKLPTFNYLLPFYRKFREDGYLIQSIPESIKNLNESYMGESDQFINWFHSEYEKTKCKDDIIKISDVFQNYCTSEYYANLTKADKRANSKTKFIENVSKNVLLRVFYKEQHKPYINGKQVCLRNILTNYKVRQDQNE